MSLLCRPWPVTGPWAAAGAALYRWQIRALLGREAVLFFVALSGGGPQSKLGKGHWKANALEVSGKGCWSSSLGRQGDVPPERGGGISFQLEYIFFNAQRNMPIAIAHIEGPFATRQHKH